MVVSAVLLSFFSKSLPFLLLVRFPRKDLGRKRMKNIRFRSYDFFVVLLSISLQLICLHIQISIVFILL